MTTRKTLLALAIPMALSSSALYANDIQEVTAPQQATLAQTQAKLKGQSPLTTRFIIKYKDNAELGTSAATMPGNGKARAKKFVDGFKTNRGQARAQYVREMALQNHHVIRADKKLSAKEAQQFMQDMVASGEVEYIEIDQMLKPFATPNDPRYGDQWHYYEAAAGINAPAAWDFATGAGVNRGRA